MPLQHRRSVSISPPDQQKRHYPSWAEESKETSCCSIPLADPSPPSRVQSRASSWSPGRGGGGYGGGVQGGADGSYGGYSPMSTPTSSPMSSYSSMSGYSSSSPPPTKPPAGETASWRRMAVFLAVTLSTIAAVSIYSHQRTSLQMLLNKVEALTKERDDILMTESDKKREWTQRARELAKARSEAELTLKRERTKRQEAEREAAEAKAKAEQAEAQRVEKGEDKEKEGAKSDGEEVTAEQSKALEVAAKTIEGLKESIRRSSRREVVEMYGPGPYRVEFELVLPQQQQQQQGEGKEEGEKEDVKEDVRYLTVEMAPLSLMPHSVHKFLTAVSSGVWDNTLLVRNRSHVLVARTLDATTHEDKSLSHARREDGANDLALDFREHSDEYPHVRGTVGFSGRPFGGPNFYVNKVDNTADHGRGPHQSRDGKYADEEEGDPCFGKVVGEGGMDLVDEISNLPVLDDGHGTFERPVVIRTARVMTKQEEEGKEEGDGKWVKR